MKKKMLTTDCKFLENELMDVARLFKRRPESVRHTFRFAEGVFYNTFWVDGEEHRFEEKGMAEDEVTYKRLERRFAKLALYDVLSERFGEKMPWGALTGIRPTKLAYRELSEGRDFQPLFEKMRVSEENISVIRRILKAQEGIYAIDEQATDLFVSLPFCPSKCAYCSFITAPIEKTRGFLPAYLAALKKELAGGASYSDEKKMDFILDTYDTRKDDSGENQEWYHSTPIYDETTGYNLAVYYADDMPFFIDVRTNGEGVLKLYYWGDELLMCYDKRGSSRVESYKGSEIYQAVAEEFAHVYELACKAA